MFRYSAFKLLRFYGAITVCFMCLFYAYQAQASSTLLGAKGLITAPNARSYDGGQIWSGIGYHDPYVHGFIGAQISDALGVTFRQSMEISNPLRDPDRFLPSVDVKLRLREESRAQPEMALGLQSALGHKRFSGEYLAASKRFYNWDFTSGIGWGRYAQGITMNNPLSVLGGHFDRRRDSDGDMPAQPSHWFTGEDVGFFAGAQYQTRYDGLSIKADIGADHYSAESDSFDYDAPVPWAIGVNYALPLSQSAQLDTQIALHSSDRISLRMGLSDYIKSWATKPRPEITSLFARHRPRQMHSVDEVAHAAAREGIILSQTDSQAAQASMTTQLSVNPHYSLPSQIGRAAVHMGNSAHKSIEKLTVETAFLGLIGPKISLMRSDLERAYHHKGSLSEIWQNAQITDGDHSRPWWRKRQRTADLNADLMPFTLILDQQNSLAEEDYAALSRTSLIAKLLLPRKTGYLDYGVALRLNAHDNLRQIRKYRQRSPLPVRSDVDLFAQDTLSLDEAFVAFTHSLTPNTHVALMHGYLEEMYAGAGGEILYRPAQSRFALSAEAFIAMKRDPQSTLHAQLTGDTVLTAQATGYYDLPHHDITVQASLGRFLNADTGMKVGFEKQFENGATLSGHMGISDTADPDVYGGATHADHGLRLTLPLGGIKHVPDYVQARLSVQPFGRDILQSINKPLDLHRITNQWSAPHITRHWDDLIVSQGL